MKYIIQLITLIALVFTANTALAKGGGKPPPAPEPSLMNVVTVSPMYGDFTSPVEAINSILDASAINPYLIQIGPGVYDIGSAQIIMKPWVRIEGAGKIFTKITGTMSNVNNDAASALVIGADDAALIGMGIENTGGSTYSIGILNDNVAPAIKHVKVSASGGLLNRGIYNHNYSSPVLVNVGASASGGNNNIGIYNTYYSSPRLLEVTASASYGSAVWVGMYNAIASPFVQDSTFTGGPGLRLDVNARDARIINSMIIGGIADFAEGQQCRGVYDESLDDIDC